MNNFFLNNEYIVATVKTSSVCTCKNSLCIRIYPIFPILSSINPILPPLAVITSRSSVLIRIDLGLVYSVVFTIFCLQFIKSLYPQPFQKPLEISIELGVLQCKFNNRFKVFKLTSRIIIFSIFDDNSVYGYSLFF